MGTIRVSNHYSDNPRHSNILLDDINEMITIRSKSFDTVVTFDVFDYDQYYQLNENGRVGAMTGNLLKELINVSNKI